MCRRTQATVERADVRNRLDFHLVNASRKKKALIAGQVVVIGALVCGTGAFIGLNKQVTMTVDGEQQQVRTFGNTVDEVLAAQDVDFEERDQVQPGRSASVERGMNIVVNTAKDVELTVDGVTTTETTNANTVGQALSDLGVDAEGAEVSADLEEPLASATGVEGAEAIDVVTAKTVKVNVAGEVKKVDNVVSSVADVLDAAGVELDDNDIVSIPLAAPVADGQTVDVMAVEDSQVTETESIAHETVTKETDDLYEGETEVETEGKDGSKEIVYAVRTIDGEEASKEKISEKVTAEPVDEVVLKGTKEKPAPEPEPESSSSSSSSSDSGSSSDDSGSGNTGADAPTVPSGSVWDQLAQCESTGNWSINTGNGYYGGLQFSASTWKAFGGGKYAEYAHQATREQQIDIAEKVQASQGWGAWPSCTSKLGIR